MAIPANDIERLVDVYATEIQALENALAEILLAAHTNPADTIIVGEQLDGIGRILNLDRQGLGDLVYRSRLSARVLTLGSSGTINELTAITDLFLGAGLFTITYNELDQFDAAFEITITETLAFELGAQLALVIRAARSAGINGYVTFHQSTPIFAFDAFGGGKFDYDDADTNVGFGISSALGPNGQLDSSTTDLTVELALNDIVVLSGFTNTAANDGQYRVTGTPTASTAQVVALEAGRALIDEAAAASVTLETDGFNFRTSLG